MSITYQELINMNGSSRELFIKKLETKLKGKFEFINWEYILPVFLHKKLGMQFVFVPCSTFNMGFSLEEEENAKIIGNTNNFERISWIPLSEMRPVHKETLNPFLMSRTPVLYKLTKNLIFNSSDSYKKFYERYKNDEYNQGDYFAAYVGKEEAENIAESLGCRLPYEAEWEFCCRGGGNTLFFWGNSFPNDDYVFEGYINPNKSFLYPNPDHANPFGFFGLFIGEWCKDQYRESYELNAKVKEEYSVIRGKGGADCWPWQSDDWTLCMSAARRKSEVVTYKEGSYGDPSIVTPISHFRLVYELQE